MRICPVSPSICVVSMLSRMRRRSVLPDLTIALTTIATHRPRNDAYRCSRRTSQRSRGTTACERPLPGSRHDVVDGQGLSEHHRGVFYSCADPRRQEKFPAGGGIEVKLSVKAGRRAGNRDLVGPAPGTPKPPAPRLGFQRGGDRRAEVGVGCLNVSLAAPQYGLAGLAERRGPAVLTVQVLGGQQVRSCVRWPPSGR